MSSNSFTPKSPYYTYEIWSHTWETAGVGYKQRVHRQVLCEIPTREKAEEFIKAMSHLLEYRLKNGGRYTIRKRREYFFIYREKLQDIEKPVYFLDYSTGCRWLDRHYKDVFISDAGDYKDYLLKLTKNWAKEAGVK